MVKLHPNYINKDGQKEYIVLPYKEFKMMEEELQEYEDLKQLREAITEEKDAPVKTIQAVKEELGL